jgi:hypothetical protein
MRFRARVPYLGDEIEVYIPLVPNAIVWSLVWLAPHSEYLWQALALWKYVAWVMGGNPYCN